MKNDQVPGPSVRGVRVFLSLVIAMVCQKARQFAARVVVLQHRKELIRQNAAKKGSAAMQGSSRAWAISH